MAKRQFGSIRKIDGGRWQVRYRDPLTGKRVPAPHTFTSRADASRWLAKMEAGTLDARTLKAHTSDERLGPYAEEWIAHRRLKPRTRETYEGQYRLHIAPTFAEARIARIDARSVRRWHSELLNGELSEVTVAKVYRLLRTILATAVEDGMLMANPCQIKGASVERSAERPIPSVDDLRRISEAMPDRLALAPWIAGLAGLRKGELLGLARRHIDLDAGTIRVERALQEQTGVGAVFVEPKSAAGRRAVGMPGALVPLVERHLAEHVAAQPDALVFTNTHGRPVRATVWAAAWNDARKSTGLGALRLHDLRHLAGTLTAQAGATTREVMDRLGHSSVEAAMRYQHVAEQRRTEVARRIDRLIL